MTEIAANGSRVSPEPQSAVDQLFDVFCKASTFQTIMSTFQQLCDLLNLHPGPNFYPKIRASIRSWRAKSLWVKLDKRAEDKEYKNATCCSNTRVMVVGAGPCGLRTAIEVALLGGTVVVVEKRDRFSRNNVLHLWPYLIQDLRGLGAKKFFGQFCAGAIDHISIRSLQCILLKAALVLGVEVHPGVTFVGLSEPSADKGWTSTVEPADHPLSQFEFDVIIGADGKRNTLPGFKKKEFRGKLAIAITANFINRHTQQEARVEEISGVAFIFNQKFFKDLETSTGIDLENIVYYKDETHYFVMTAKKTSLLHKNVLKQDYGDTAQLLSQSNVDQRALEEYGRQAADVSTRGKLPSLDYAHNHYGQPDVAMFDFTSMYQALHASRVIERNKCKLLMGLVGDSLLEPFWPTGSGLARGFFGALDAGWMIRSWASGSMTPLEVLAERESIYQLLSQTTPENTNRNFDMYTVDPNTRYPNLNMQFFKPHQVRNLYEGVDSAYLDHIVEISEQRSRKYEWVRNSHNLLKWVQKQLEPYKDTVQVVDLSPSSWTSGIALCSLLHRYLPDHIQVDALNAEDAAKNNKLAFDVVEKQLGIVPLMSAEDVAAKSLDETSLISYLYQLYQQLRKKDIKPTPVAKTARKVPQVRVFPRRSATKEQERPPLTTGSSKTTPVRYMAQKRKVVAMHERLEDQWADNVANKIPARTQPGFPSRHAGERGNNLVSKLATNLEAKFTGSASILSLAIPPPPEKMMPKPIILGQAPGTDLCHFCHKRVYQVERQSAEGVVFHRSCLRCHFCASALRIGQYSFVRSEHGFGKFYCFQHYGQQRPQRKMPTGANAFEDEMGVDGREVETDSRLGSAQERVEYQTESDWEESETEQTEHNLSASRLRMSGVYSPEETESSSSSESVSSDERSDAVSTLSEGADEEKYLSPRRRRRAPRPRSFLPPDDSDTDVPAASDDDEWTVRSDSEGESERKKKKVPTATLR